MSVSPGLVRSGCWCACVVEFLQVLDRIVHRGRCLHQDGLVHISQLADKFVDDPNKVVKVGDQVQVTVTEVDLQRQRIALSMKQQPEIDRKKEHSSSSGGGKPHGRSQARGNHGGRTNRGGGNDFGGNWFDAALKR